MAMSEPGVYKGFRGWIFFESPSRYEKKESSKEGSFFHNSRGSLTLGAKHALWHVLSAVYERLARVAPYEGSGSKLPLLAFLDR